jgi:hypothetical protein
VPLCLCASLPLYLPASTYLRRFFRAFTPGIPAFRDPVFSTSDRLTFPAAPEAIFFFSASA